MIIERIYHLKEPAKAAIVTLAKSYQLLKFDYVGEWVPMQAGGILRVEANCGQLIALSSYEPGYTFDIYEVTGEGLSERFRTPHHALAHLLRCEFSLQMLPSSRKVNR